MKKDENTRRRMTAEELERVKQNLLKRKSELWQEISENIEDDAREEYQELVQSIRDGSDRALAELEETDEWLARQIQGSHPELAERLKAARESVDALKAEAAKIEE